MAGNLLRVQPQSGVLMVLYGCSGINSLGHNSNSNEELAYPMNNPEINAAIDTKNQHEFKNYKKTDKLTIIIYE